MDFLSRERPERDRTEKSHLDTLFTSTLDTLLRNTGSTAESHDHIVGILTALHLVAHLRLTDFPVFLLHHQITLLHHFRFQFQGSHDIRLSVLLTTDGSPRTFLCNLLFRAARFHRRKHHLLHHLTDDTITQYHRRITVFESQGESQVHEVSHLLHRSRSQYNHIIVTITTTTSSLEIITLRRLDSTQSRTATLHVDDDTRNLGTRHIGNTLLHQSHTRTRRSSKHTLTSTRTAINHIDGSHLTLSLEHHHTRSLPRFEQSQSLYNFTLWSNRIAKETIHTTSDAGMSNRLITLHQSYFTFLLFSHYSFSFLRYTVIHPSGHTMAHEVQPTHASGTAAST